MKKTLKRMVTLLLTLSMLLSLCSGALAAETGNAAALTMDDVVSIQAYTDATAYGTGVVEIDVTYKAGTDLSKVAKDSYVLEDRGSLSPDFGEVEIKSVEVNGDTVTLNILRDFDATELNSEIYTGTGPEKGVRQRNSFGVYVTGAWYRDTEGTIYYGKDDTDAYADNTTGMGYQARACLELKLRHAGEAASAAECLADDMGQYNEDGKWLKTIDRQFGENGFKSLYALQIPSTAAGATDGTGDAYVRGYYYVPKNYNPANGIIFTLQGQGISYWQLADGTNDDGTGIMFDTATTSWANTGAIVVNIHDRSSASRGEYWDIYDFVVDDARVMKYFIDTYEITGSIALQGNSRGTMASAILIKALAGQSYNPKNQNMGGSEPETYTLDKNTFDFTVDAFICQNGSFGYGYDEADWAAIADTGLRVWAFNGEQDTNDIAAIATYTDIMTEKKGAAWAKENVRLTGLTSDLFWPLGESDHSVTRINGWYFADKAYYGPDLTANADGTITYNTKLNDGDTYTLECRGGAASTNKVDYEYTVYDDSFHKWALNLSEATVSADDIVSIQATAIASFYGYKVGSVKITYAEGTDLSSVSVNDYTLYDRGFQTPEFGKVEVTTAKVSGNVVTLYVDEGTDKTADRSRETYGTLCTSSNWYVDSDGNIHYGKTESTDALGITIYPNTISKGLQWRENMDLVLCVNDDDITKGIRSTNGAGKLLEDTVWKETILGDDLDKVELELVNVGWNAKNYTMLSDEGKVPVHVIYPDNYDVNRAEPYPVVVYQCGGGVCYWEVTDGSTTAANNLGCNVVYDVMMTEWHRQMPDAIIMSVNVHSSTVQNSATEIAGVLDYSIENWNVDKDRIIIVGNSQGTLISSDVIRQRPDLIAGYVECNGNLGGMGTADMLEAFNTEPIWQNTSLATWTEAEVQAMIANEVSVWMFNGETDGTNPGSQQDVIEAVEGLYRNAGKSEEWLYDHVRASGLQSWKFKKWGETDHSVTKVVAWYYISNPYMDVWEGQSSLAVGDTYTYAGLEDNYNYYEYTKDYQYTVYAESVAEWARLVLDLDEPFIATDLSKVEQPSHDYSEANQLPLTGYFKASLTGENADREVRYYIPEIAMIRPYYHFIAVPNNVDVDEFLVESGWKQLSDETGECLFVLMPDQTTKQWGSAEDEMSYMNAAKAYHSGNGKYFTTFGEFYLVGYGEGVAPLQAWAAENPHLIIAQSYISGSSYGADTLAASGEGVYGYSHMTDGDNKNRDGDDRNERRNADGTWKFLYQLTDYIKSVLNADAGENAGLLKKSDMPVPTWFVNVKNDAASVAYWKQVNKADGIGTAVNKLGAVSVSGSVYNQNGDTWATEYAGRISKVTELTTQTDTASYAFTRALRDEMVVYTRYDNTISYGNGLMYRLDYSDIQHERYTSKDKYAIGTVSGTTLSGREVSAELSMQLMPVLNTAGNTVNSDLLLYVPETAGSKDIPVVVVFHGGSQTAALFMDSTCWWQTAAEEGFALAFSTRTAHSGGNLGSIDVGVLDATLEILEADGRFDMSRIYATGQSMGSVATITVSEERAEKLAAVISSNAGNPSATSGGDFIPAGMVVGDGNYANRGIPGYVADTAYPEDEVAEGCFVRSTGAAAAGADIYWDLAVTSKGAASHNMNSWVDYYLDANGLTNDDLREGVIYSGASALNQGTNGVGTLAEWKTNTARYRTWYWDNEDGIPLITYVMAMYQAHNCQPGYRPLMWDFLEHYSLEVASDGSVTRYYSESAFAEDDAVVIYANKTNSSSPVNPTPSKPAIGTPNAPADKPEAKTFRDVHGAGHWSAKAVDFVVARGLFNGTSENLFSPDIAMSRGMLAMVLYRLEGEPAASAASNRFADVAKGSYYDKAISWAVENGILSGYGDGRMGADNPITREQLATMLWRYSKSPAANESLAKFSDAAQVSDYATNAMNWAVQNGIVNGRGNGILAPNGQATRAEAAQMLMNFLQYTGK